MRRKIARRGQEQAEAYAGTLAPVGVGIAAGEVLERVAWRIRAAALAGGEQPIPARCRRRLIEGVAHHD
jgi:hypothetical protein